MNYRKILILCGIALTVPTSLLAQAPVKSVDQAGNVTYSDRPTVDATSSIEVTIDPGPDQSEIDAAKQRADQTKNRADKAQAERDALAKKREAERKAGAASKAEKQTEVIEESGYPAYNRPIRPVPPMERPPTGARPPANRPVPLPLPAPR